MKNKKTVIIGVFCGIVCALSVFLYTGTVQAEALADREEMLARYGGEQLEACVATRDIMPGETVSQDNVTTKLWLADLLPDGAIISLDEALGMKASSSIIEGEALSAKRFASADDSFDVPKGTSAISVPAKDVQAIGGSIAVGTKVDVYVTGATSTELLVKEVPVLATSASTASNPSSGFSWITLALKNESIEEVITASQKMELYFVLPG